MPFKRQEVLSLSADHQKIETAVVSVQQTNKQEFLSLRATAEVGRKMGVV